MATFFLVFILYLYQANDFELAGDFRTVNSINVGVRYIYVAGNGVMRYDKLFSHWEAPRTKIPFPNSIKLIAQDLWTNEIWFVTNSELCRYNPTFENLKMYKYEGGTTCSIGISEKYIYLPRKSSAGIKKFDKNAEEWVENTSENTNVEWFPVESPSDFPYLAPWYVMDKSNTRYKINCVSLDGQWLWVGTNGYGIYKYNNVSHFVEEHFLSAVPGGELITMFEDGENIWFSLTDGVVKNGIEYSYFPLNRIPNLLPSPGIAIAGNDSKIWIGSQEGISQYNKETEIWINWTKPELRDVISLFSQDQQLWVGTKNGLVKYENGIYEKIIENVWVNDISQNSNALWIATSRGAFYITTLNEYKIVHLQDPYKSLGFGVNKVLCNGNKIYFGTKQGLLSFVTIEEQWNKWAYPVCLPGTEVLSLAKDKNTLLVGTNNGLAIWNMEKDIWTHYTEENSAIKGNVKTIVITKDFIYINIDKGLVRVRRIEY